MELAPVACDNNAGDAHQLLEPDKFALGTLYVSIPCTHSRSLLNIL